MLSTHNNLVRVHQADVATDGKIVIAMDYFPEGSITTLSNPGNFLPLPTAIRTMVDVLQGLEHLHLNNFFHNDVKPQNILRGPHSQAKLTDYGIVGISSNGAPLMPSCWYVLHAAPETVAGNGIEARTDIFQAGLTMFRLLAGLGSLEAKFNSLGAEAYASRLANGSLISRADLTAVHSQRSLSRSSDFHSSQPGQAFPVSAGYEAGTRKAVIRGALDR